MARQNSSMGNNPVAPEMGKNYLEKGLGIYAVAPGTTIEEMQALFFDKNALHEPSYKLSQLNCKGKRQYYRYDDEGKPIFYPSVTTILRDVMPENRNLTDWKLSLGKEASQAFTQERANYGTFLHGQLAELMITRRYNLETLREKMEKYAEREHLSMDFVDSHEDEAKADILSFAKWMQDYDVKPLAIEVSLYSENMQLAGMLDCVGNLRCYSLEDEKKAMAKLADEATKAAGDEKKLQKISDKTKETVAKFSERLNGIIDFKSGKKGFYDEYAIQLELYRRMWNENFPEVPIDRIFNIAPKDWTKTVNKRVSYSFEEQTENPVLRKVDALLALYALEEPETRKVVSITGEVVLDNPDCEGANVKVVALEELIALRSDENRVEAPEEDNADPFANL